MQQKIKNIWRLLAFLALAFVLPLAVEAQNRFVFIEGTGTAEQQAFFLENFKMEGIAAGYNIVANKSHAGYVFRFDVTPQTQPGEKPFHIQITLLRNFDNFELVTFDYPFTRLDEMYDVTQYLFLKAVVYIPVADGSRAAPGTPGAPGGAAADRIPEEREVIDMLTRILEAVAPHEVQDGQRPREIRDTGEAWEPGETRENTDWQNKWLYARLSLDFPIVIYNLQPNGLIGGTGVYEGTFQNPTSVSQLDNKYVALPGITLGLEIQFLNWMSVEPIFLASLGDPFTRNYLNMTAGINLKAPLKFFRGIIVEPYGAFLYPLKKAPAFIEFPLFGFGGGLQLCIKAGKWGAAFIDLNYLYFGDTVMINPYGDLYPKPDRIHYNRTVIGLGIGYKYGLFNRK
ncbi:MAG: hypothetical protein LBH07_01370 [Treponema sp.]|nr:hypothetical protein [Treponema sp.]